MSAVSAANADVPLAYYSSLDGKCGSALKDAIHTLVSNNVKMLSYGSGSNKTWWGFYVTDYLETPQGRQVVDRYSNDLRYYGSRGSSVSGMNIEHSFPKSWWGGSEGPNAYRDLYNLMPSEAKINSSKSNYAMGSVTDASTDNGCTKVGTGSLGKSVKLWEPADKWKGDFARDYMYMATAYQNLTWTTDNGLASLENNTYPTFKEWAYKLYIEWAKQDAVDDLEIARNDAVSQIQGNRNPFVDFPNIMEYVWGDSISTPLNIATTVKAGSTTDTPVDKTVTVFEADFTQSNAGGCETSGTSGIWVTTANYGWKASGFISGKCTQADATLTTPSFKLAGLKSATLTFKQAANKFNSGKPQDFLSVGVSVDGGAPEELTGITWPVGTNWTTISSGDIDLSKYIGHDVKVIYRYTSTTESACTWEIFNMKVTGVTSSEGVDIIVPETENDDNCPVEYYSLDGRRINPFDARGLVIRRQGNKVSKIIVR